MRARRQALVVAAVVGGLVASTVTMSPAQAITKSEVEQVCADSREAYDSYQTAREDFQAVSEDLEAANWALAEAESKEQRIRGQFESNRNLRAELEPKVESQAIDLYMRAAGAGTAGMVALDKPEDALVAFEFMRSTTDDGMEALNDLGAISAELDRLGVDLDAVVEDRTDLRDQQQALTDRQEEAMEDALASYEQLTDDCKQIQADYEAEQARLRAEEERRRREAEAQRRAEAAAGSSDGSSGGSSTVVNGLVCPFTPGRTQFTNSYGAPRSGGRSHRGVDMMAPWDEPIYAVESGTVTLNTGGLGGNQIFLTGTSGAYYYYAHLNTFNVPSGASVSQGDLIGFNGDSGNASGGAPHVHFQIWPNGYSGGIINPYYSMAAVCF